MFRGHTVSRRECNFECSIQSKTSTEFTKFEKYILILNLFTWLALLGVFEFCTFLPLLIKLILIYAIFILSVDLFTLLVGFILT